MTVKQILQSTVTNTKYTSLDMHFNWKVITQKTLDHWMKGKHHPHKLYKRQHLWGVSSVDIFRLCWIPNNIVLWYFVYHCQRLKFSTNMKFLPVYLSIQSQSLYWYGNNHYDYTKKAAKILITQLLNYLIICQI